MFSSDKVCVIFKRCVRKVNLPIVFRSRLNGHYKYYIKLCMLCVLVKDAWLSPPKPKKARHCRFAHRPKINYSRPSANFYLKKDPI